jgi:hypothetical protein
MTNPNSPIIRSGKTSDGVSVFLHADGTISDRLATVGFTTVNTEVMDAFFDRISSVRYNHLRQAIKKANRGHLPPTEGEYESRLSATRQDAFRAAELSITYDRSIR